ncbi:hypothetical protein RQP46_010039 [Phenoliferia psychrophenolica]
MTSFFRDFRFTLHTGESQLKPALQLKPLKDTRAPFNSGSWTAHCSVHCEQVTYSVVWSEVESSVLSNIDQFSFRLGSPENGSADWGEEVEVMPEELNNKWGSGSSRTETFQFDEAERTYGSVLSVKWRLREAHESAPTKEDAGRRLADQNDGVVNVCFVFPRDGGRVLWVNDKILGLASPYYKKCMFSKAPVIPGAISSTSLDPSSPRSALAFDDSDDDDALAKSPLPEPEPTLHPHHTIKITDFSYHTYRAVFSWILSHHIDFRPRDANAPTLKVPSSSSSPRRPASPKSVYRLANLLEITELQALALEAIRSQVTVATVVADLFSQTSLQYPAVLDLLCEFMEDNREEMLRAGIWDEIAEKVNLATPEVGKQLGLRLLARVFKIASKYHGQKYLSLTMQNARATHRDGVDFARFEWCVYFKNNKTLYNAVIPIIRISNLKIGPHLPAALLTRSSPPLFFKERISSPSPQLRLLASDFCGPPEDPALVNALHSHNVDQLLRVLLPRVGSPRFRELKDKLQIDLPERHISRELTPDPESPPVIDSRLGRLADEADTSSTHEEHSPTPQTPFGVDFEFMNKYRNASPASSSATLVGMSWHATGSDAGSDIGPSHSRIGDARCKAPKGKIGFR